MSETSLRSWIVRPLFRVAVTALLAGMLCCLAAGASPAMAQSSPSPSPTPSMLPSGQTPPSPLGGLAPFGLVIGVLLIGGVSVLYGRRNQ